MNDFRVIIQEQEGKWYIFDKDGIQVDGTSEYDSRGDAEEYCDSDNNKLQRKNTGLFLLKRDKR